MKKETFLQLQYLRMNNSEEFVVELWGSSLDRFIADMWDRTPVKPAARFLAPVDPSLGFSPDNVEWQFPKIKPRKGVKTAKAVPTPMEPPRPTKEKRKAIAEEYASMGRLRNSGCE